MALTQPLLLQASRLVGGLFLLLAMVLFALAPQMLGVLAPGLPAATLAPHGGAFRLMTVALPLAALSGVVVALLNANGRFAIGAAGNTGVQPCGHLLPADCRR
jgi:peptidoglycan biosynthesis protein MviN/MurJ (putative lipid II flippase)